MASKQLMRRIVDEEINTNPISVAASTKKPSVARRKGGKSEKRRLAALKTWEKRRMKQRNAASEETVIFPPVDASTHVSDMLKSDDVLPSNASNCTATEVPKAYNKRSIAALKTWAKRRANQAAALSNTSSIVLPIEDDDNTSTSEKDSMKTIRNATGSIPSISSHRRGKVNKRSLAALKTWEKRRQRLIDASTKPNVIVSTSDAVVIAANAEETSSNATDAAVSTNGYVRKHKQGYTAELRSQAAKAAWEKRKRLKSMKQSTPHDVTDTSEEDSATSKQVEPKPKAATKKRKTWQDPDLKRSRPRRTSQELDGIDEALKDANQVITHLKHSRGWMEFHPSSRYGNGTADYAYIPGSLAQFIRNGAFSKPIVMEYGTLGIHYALDYDGYGGLKEMIETFGEDHSPCPSDKMIEASHEMQEKKDSKMEQIDLGEDLPWKEVEAIENERVNNLCAEKRKHLQAENDAFELSKDIEEVANILASLRDVHATCIKPVDAVSLTATATNNPSSFTSPTKKSSKPSYSPALNALTGYDSESSEDDSEDDSVANNSSTEELESANDSPKLPSESIPSSSSDIVAKSSDAQVENSLPLEAPLYYNQGNDEASHDENMFGVPLYNPTHTASQQTSNSKPPKDCHTHQFIHSSIEEYAHGSSNDGIYYTQDNKEVMLLAPLEEDEEVDT